jgi:hypothetical protein
VRFLPPLFSVIGSAQLVKRFFKVNGDKDGESTLQHQRPPPLLGPATQTGRLARQSWMKSISCSAAAAHPMAASVGPDGGQYIGQQILVDRFLGSRQCRVKVPLPSGPDQRGGAAGTLDGVA